jgi:hypothetical protein
MYISSLCYYFFLNLLWIKKKSNHETLQYPVCNFNNYFVSCVHYILFRNRSNFYRSNLPIVIITTDNDPAQTCRLKL